MNKMFRGQNKRKSSGMIDYGNISSSGNNSIDAEIDNLYNFQYQIKTDLPLDIIENKDKINNANPKNTDDEIDLSILTKALLPASVINNKENDKVWTFDSMLNDLQKAFQKK